VGQRAGGRRRLAARRHFLLSALLIGGWWLATGGCLLAARGELVEPKVAAKVCPTDNLWQRQLKVPTETSALKGRPKSPKHTRWRHILGLSQTEGSLSFGGQKLEDFHWFHSLET